MLSAVQLRAEKDSAPEGALKGEGVSRRASNDWAAILARNASPGAVVSLIQPLRQLFKAKTLPGCDGMVRPENPRRVAVLNAVMESPRIRVRRLKRRSTIS